jgi:SnoaL-like polyketide cyclase
MAEATQVEVRSWEVFNDHAEWAPNIAEFVFEAAGKPGRDPEDAGAGDEETRLEGFADARKTVHRKVVNGPWVIQEFTFEGTHTAPFESPIGIIPATGKRVVVKCVQISRHENGRATEIKLYYDQFELLSQLGVMRQRQAAQVLGATVTRPAAWPVEDPYSGWK